MAQEKQDSLIAGHRKRLKDRFARSTLGSFDEYELLELLLFYTVPRKDTKPLAKKLIKKFGSIKAVFYADEASMKEVDGMTINIINYFKTLEDFFMRLSRPSKQEGHILNNWSSVLNYCTLTMAFKKQEALRVLYLDRKNRLIYDENSQQGTVDQVAIYPREIVKTCINKSASAVILVHNHPSGDTTPSTEDIELTKKVSVALNSIGAILHDHIIVSYDKHFSFRANGLIN